MVYALRFLAIRFTLFARGLIDVSFKEGKSSAPEDGRKRNNRHGNHHGNRKEVRSKYTQHGTYLWPNAAHSSDRKLNV